MKTCETCKNRGEPINIEKNIYWCECGKTCVNGSAWEKLDHSTEKGGEGVMAEWIKPPIGVSPHWFVYRQRIDELNKAIARYLEHIEKKQHTAELKQEYEAIAEWAKEIQHLALLEADLCGTPKERGGEK